MRAVRLLLWTLASIQQTTNTTRPLSRARGLQTERIVWCRRAGAWHGRPHMGANGDGKKDEKFKKRKRARKSSFLCLCLF